MCKIRESNKAEEFTDEQPYADLRPQNLVIRFREPLLNPPSQAVVTKRETLDKLKTIMRIETEYISQLEAYFDVYVNSITTVEEYTRFETRIVSLGSSRQAVVNETKRPLEFLTWNFYTLTEDETELDSMIIHGRYHILAQRSYSHGIFQILLGLMELLIPIKFSKHVRDGNILVVGGWLIVNSTSPYI